jgi:hypothetical protein
VKELVKQDEAGENDAAKHREFDSRIVRESRNHFLSFFV